MDGFEARSGSCFVSRNRAYLFELIKAEQSGFIDERAEGLLADFKEEVRRDEPL